MRIDIKIPLIELAFIRIDGADAAKFLQGQLTCDVREVAEQQSRLGAHCDPKGRIQFTFRLFFYHDSYYLQLPAALIAHAMACLQKYAVFFKVQLTDMQGQWQSLGLVGQMIAQTLTKLGYTLPQQDNAVVANMGCFIVKIPGAIPRFMLCGDLNSIEKLNKQLTLIASEFNAWHLQDILANMPTIMPETSNEFTPHVINYDEVGGISFNKGCYTGQEIVARMHYLGKLKQRLYQIQFKTSEHVLPNTVIMANNQVMGHVINSALQEDGSYIALASLQDSAISQPLMLNNGEQSTVHVILHRFAS
jgi:hypothetical protein